MKKLVSFLILFVMLIMLAPTVKAASKDNLADTLYNMGKPYGMSTSDKVKIERYLADNEVTEEQADQIIAKAKQAVAVMEDAGTTNYAKLSDSQKAELKSIAIEAAKILDLTLEFSNKELKIYQNGKLIEVITYDNNGKLVYTGNSLNTILVASITGVIALAGIIFVRKKVAHA